MFFSPKIANFAQKFDEIFVIHSINIKKKKKKSALQIASADYQPKLPKALQGAVKIKEGAPTQSVDNQ